MDKRQKGFRCSNPECGQWVCDVNYRGPAGHAPADLCWECWCEHWDRVHTRTLNEGNWTDMDQMLWLVCKGMTHKHAAGLIGRHRNTVRRWILRMRSDPSLIPLWLLKKTGRNYNS